eukprot:gene3620-biopygen1061
MARPQDEIVHPVGSAFVIALAPLVEQTECDLWWNTVYTDSLGNPILSHRGIRERQHHAMLEAYAVPGYEAFSLPPVALRLLDERSQRDDEGTTDWVDYLILGSCHYT